MEDHLPACPYLGAIIGIAASWTRGSRGRRHLYAATTGSWLVGWLARERKTRSLLAGWLGGGAGRRGVGGGAGGLGERGGSGTDLDSGLRAIFSGRSDRVVSGGAGVSGEVWVLVRLMAFGWTDVALGDG